MAEDQSDLGIRQLFQSSEAGSPLQGSREFGENVVQNAVEGSPDDTTISGGSLTFPDFGDAPEEDFVVTEVPDASGRRQAGRRKSLDEENSRIERNRVNDEGGSNDSIMRENAEVDAVLLKRDETGRNPRNVTESTADVARTQNNGSHELCEKDASNTNCGPTGTESDSLMSMVCRICHEKDLLEDSNTSPCLCKGTLSLVHRSCLREWLVTSDSTRCELCGFQFNVQRIPRYPVLRSVWRWMNSGNSPSERRYIANGLNDLILDCPLVLAANYLWFAKADSLLQALEYAMEKTLPLREGYPLYNEVLRSIGQVASLMMLCPIGILTGSHLMMCFFRAYEQWRLWYSWHRRQTTLIFIEKEKNARKQTNT